ncbi:MAG: phosphatase PAP2 family protein, partial [Nitrospiraceae bacterium]|nr:phosphatase PAP2 family protein [Nitrospiraceae bacterium]
MTTAACGTLPNGRGWGQDATIAPGWGRVGEAAWNALSAPETWAPAAGALAFRINHADRNVSEWAAKSTPVYGSQMKAAHMSDNLLKASGVLWAASGIATPGGPEAGEWIENKTKGFLVETVGGISMRETVAYLKNATDRTRPNGRDQASFPSGHSSGAAVFATMTSKNIDTLGWSDGEVAAARIGLGAMTAATAWARVEANQHYPSD